MTKAICLTLMFCLSGILVQAMPGGGGLVSCSAADKTTAGNWGGNSTCGSPATNLDLTCTFESPNPTLFQEIVDECDDYIANMGQADIPRCVYVRTCGTFTAECDHINAFNVATYGTCQGFVESYDEFLYDASCSLIGTSTGTPASSWSGLTAGTSYVYCVEFQMLDCYNINSYLWGQHLSIPIAAFSFADVCLGTAASFSNQGTSGGSCTYDWDFGDGSGTSSSENPSYTYGGTGAFSVEMITCCGGCCDTITQTINVNPIPTASFTIAPVSASLCLVGNFFSFTNTGTTGGTTTYLWDYGDGTSSTGQDGSHSYAAAGGYSVCLTTDVDGCTDQTCLAITVDPAPVLTVSPVDETCTGLGDGSIDLTINGGSCGACLFSWVDGLGAAAGSTEDLSGLVPDTYTVTVTDASGCTAVTSATVNDPGVPCGCTVTPGFSISPSNIQCVETNSFTLTETTPHSHGSSSILIEWDVEDDGTIDGSGNSYGAFSYASSGTFTVRQYVIDTSVPCTLSTTGTITVNEATATAAPAIEICQGGTASLFCSGGVSYAWVQTSGAGGMVDAGTQTPDVTPTGSNPTVNTYTCTITDADGCTATATQDVTFNALAVSAGPDVAVCVNQDVTLNGSYANETVLGGLGASTTLTSSPGTVIPNNNGTGITDNINYGTAYTLVQQVCVDITHGSANELLLQLTDPCGRQITLSNLNGNDELDDYDGTCFDDASLTPITSASANPPFPASYSPEGALSGLDSCASSGNWSLTLIDNVNKTKGSTYQGSLNSWSITFAEYMAAGDPLQVWTPSAIVSPNDTAVTVFNYNTFDDNPVTQTLTVTDDNCTVTDDVGVLVCECNLRFTDTTNAQIGQPGDDTFTFTFTEAVFCDSVDATDFDVSVVFQAGSGCGPFSIVSATPINCANDAFSGQDTTRSVTFVISPGMCDSTEIVIDPSATTNVVNRCSDAQRSGGALILPIELVYLIGSPVEEGVLLEWATATEHNNAYFAIERSRDGKAFTSIGRVEGAGNSSVEQIYEFTDTEPYTNINYYRIRQTDTDGSFIYSNVISVDNSIQGVNFDLVSINPIPANDKITVVFTTPNLEPVNLEIYDMVGRQVFTQPLGEVKVGANEAEIDISSITDTGVYYLIIEQGDKRLQSKMLKY